jgi:hypothetical protein
MKSLSLARWSVGARTRGDMSNIRSGFSLTTSDLVFCLAFFKSSPWSSGQKKEAWTLKSLVSFWELLATRIKPFLGASIL